MVAAAGGLDLREHPFERGLAEPAYRPRSELDAVLAAGQVALSLELALQLAQGLEVGGCRAAELPLEHVDVHVVEGAAGPVHRQRLLERLQVGELGDGLHGVAVAEGVPALAHLRRATVQSGPQRAQVVGELPHLRGEVRVRHRVAHQLAELLALLRRE